MSDASVEQTTPPRRGTTRRNPLRRKLEPKRLRSRTYAFTQQEGFEEARQARRERAKAATSPAVARQRTAAALYLGIGTAIQSVVLAAQMYQIHERGLGDHRLVFAVCVGLAVTGVLLMAAVLAGRTPRGAALTATGMYACYLGLAWLIDFRTGTFAIVVQLVALAALGRALHAGMTHERLRAEMEAGKG